MAENLKVPAGHPVSDEDRKLLQAVITHDGSDAHRTKGKTPLGKGLLSVFEQLEARGLVRLDHSELPLIEVAGGRIILGACFVALTDAGRAALLLPGGVASDA